MYGNSTLFTYVLMVKRVTPRISYHIHQSHSAFSKSNFSNNPLYPPNYPLPPPPPPPGIHYPRQIQNPAFDTYRQKKNSPCHLSGANQNYSSLHQSPSTTHEESSTPPLRLQIAVNNHHSAVYARKASDCSTSYSYCNILFSLSFNHGNGQDVEQ